MAHRILALVSFAFLSACGGPPGEPDGTARIVLQPLPRGGCYDGPLAIDVNGAPHDLTRTGQRTFVVSGPIFSALDIQLGLNGGAAYIQTSRGPKALTGDPATCRLSGRGALRDTSRDLPLDILIAPAG